LAGRIVEVPSGSSLDLRYRGPAWVYTFYVVWYLFLGFVAAGLIANGWAPEVTPGDKAMAVAIFAVLLIAPVGLHLVGTRRSDEELGDLLDFLSQHAEAKP
jgi:peptidoglycan/LPS O-acetylase OafA/YrhL